MKMKALELRGPLADLEKVSPGCEVSLMAATLRPETMCGQTNCWVLPEGDYVAVQGPGKAVYVLCASLLHASPCMPQHCFTRCPRGMSCAATPTAPKV